MLAGELICLRHIWNFKKVETKLTKGPSVNLHQVNEIKTEAN